MMNILKLLTLSMVSIHLFGEADIKKKEAEINQIEKDLKAKVSEYNKMIAEQHSDKGKTEKKEEKSTPSKTEEKPKENAPNHLNISTDPNILQEQVKQLQDTVETLMKDVKDLRENVVLKKKSERQDATKKATENDQHVLEYTEAQAKFSAAEALFQKETEENYKKAIEAFELIAQENCNHSIAYNAYNRIGDAYKKMAKWDEAIKYYNFVIDQDHAKIFQRVDAFLGRADAEREKNDRVTACKTLDALERSNLPMTQKQKDLYQSLIVQSDCASKKEHDVKEEKAEKKEEKEGAQ